MRTETVQTQIINGRESSVELINPDGSNRTTIITDDLRYDPRSLTWSPDRSRLLFTVFSDERITDDVFIINRDGSNLINVTDHPADDRYPTWSPDSSQIAFVSDRGKGRQDIYVINVDGTGLKQITFDGYFKKSLHWNPAIQQE